MNVLVYILTGRRSAYYSAQLSLVVVLMNIIDWGPQVYSRFTTYQDARRVGLVDDLLKQIFYEYNPLIPR